jgi:hypothetical protein
MPSWRNAADAAIAAMMATTADRYRFKKYGT